jgi:ABC-type multidrug transport system ATPase subunit
LCCALIHRPSVLFLDEPTTGVDAVSRKEFWEMLQQLKKQGITILVSTPYMDEASLCDRVALLQNGAILSIDKPTVITAQFNNTLLAVKADNMFGLLQVLRESGLAANSYPFGEYHHVVMKDNISIEELGNYLNQKGCTTVNIQKANANIEDCFIALMRNE